MNDQVYNIFNAPKGKDSPHGEHVYEWEYLDDEGKLQKDKEDIHAKIQSYLPRVDYKKQIERGELELDGNNLDMVSKDYRRVPDNTVDYIKFLSALASMDKEQVANLVESANQTNKNIVQKEQTANQESINGGETPRKLNADKPANSTSLTNNDGGGTKE